MAIPDYQTFMRPVLEVAAASSPRTTQHLRQAVLAQFELSPAELSERLPSGKETIVSNRIGWARTYLKKAGLISVPEKGATQITPAGLEALSNGPAKITVAWLKRFPEFLEFIEPKVDMGDASARAIRKEEITPDEQLSQAHRELARTLADELLAQVKAASPRFFEQLVLDMMLSMGYGGSRAEAGSATQLTHDDGIDGIIKEDKLGLDVIYLQAKRWSQVVHRPELDKFIGALTRKRARKVVLITTSEFSDGARAAVRGLDMRVVLIDGMQLARLMIEHGLGCSVKQVYEVKQIDTDYFNEDT